MTAQTSTRARAVIRIIHNAERRGFGPVFDINAVSEKCENYALKKPTHFMREDSRNSLDPRHARMVAYKTSYPVGLGFK
jgi:hypothetical protein